MSDSQKKVMTGLLSAVGAVAAFFGVRALMGWMRQRSYEQQYPAFDLDETVVEEIEYAKIPDETSMPQTGDVESSRPSTGQEQRMPEAGVTSTTRTELGQNYQDTYQEEDERSSIPMTGSMEAPVAEQPRTQDRARGTSQGNVSTDQSVPVSSLVGPFIVHLLSLHNMIELLKRRREAASSGTNTNTPDVRAGGADAVASLAAQVPEFDHSALMKGSLQARMVETMERVRDALQNTTYSEDQLLKMSDELRPEACKTLDLIHQAGEDDVTGFEDVQKDYGCR